jgi:hypothetical protein
MEDAGYELIGNTFLIVNKANFVENEPAALAVYTAAKLVVANMAEDNAFQQIAKTAAGLAADGIYERTRKGYTIFTRSFLYKLNWNDSVANTFYSEYWLDDSMDSTFDAERKDKIELFDNTDLFSMEYVGMERANSMVSNLFGKNRTKEQIIEQATIRNTNRVYAKLQKEYDVFKPKTPLSYIGPKGKVCQAKIGLKEGLTSKMKFEVLEQYTNKEGLTEYKKK